MAHAVLEDDVAMDTTTSSGGTGGSRGDEHAMRAPDPMVGRTDVLTGVRVLVVEDDAASRKLAILLLAAVGAETTGVATAEDALATIEATRPEVGIIDLVLPHMGGLALIEELKRRPETRGIVLVAVSGMHGVEVERLARASGCAAYVPKPIDTETFAATVATCLKERR